MLDARTVVDDSLLTGLALSEIKVNIFSLDIQNVYDVNSCSWKPNETLKILLNLGISQNKSKEIRLSLWERAFGMKNNFQMSQFLVYQN